MFLTASLHGWLLKPAVCCRPRTWRSSARRPGAQGPSGDPIPAKLNTFCGFLQDSASVFLFIPGPPKICKMMAFWAPFRGLGPFLYIPLGSRYASRQEPIQDRVLGSPGLGPLLRPLIFSMHLGLNSVPGRGSGHLGN